MREVTKIMKKNKKKLLSTSVDQQMYENVMNIVNQQNITKATALRLALNLYVEEDCNLPARALSVIQLMDTIDKQKEHMSDEAYEEISNCMANITKMCK